MNKLPKAPQITIPDRLDITPTTTLQSAAGIALHILKIPGNEVIRVSFVFEAGTSHQTKGFSASATANLLSEGSEKYSAEELAERLDFYGLFYDVGIDRDSTVVTFCSLTKFFPQLLELASEILLHPRFDQHEVEIYCVKRKQQLILERSKVSFKARELFVETLFGVDHPYGYSTPSDEYDHLSSEDMVEFYRNHYTAQGCFVVCSGDVEQIHIDGITSLIEVLESRHAPATASVQFPEPVTGKYAFLPHPGAVQSAIRVGRLLFTRTHPDFIPMQVVSTILGGYFGSRLIKNLREQRGYTYGIFAGMATLEHAGYMAIATEVAGEVTGDAIEQIFAEMEKLCNHEVGADELEIVKNIVLGEVMRILDGPFGIADVTIENIQNGVDNTYLHRFLEEVRATTPQIVMQTARKYLRREDFTVTVVGVE